MTLIEAEVELSAGHEMLFVPMMHGLHNNAANFTIEALVVTKMQQLTLPQRPPAGQRRKP